MPSRRLFCCLLTFLLLQASEVNDSMPCKEPWQLPPAESLYQEPTPFTSENPYWRVLNAATPTALECPPGQYTKQDGSACESCGTSCAYCEDFTKACLGCTDPYKMEINSSDKTQCKCKGSQSGTTICQCGTNEWFDGSTCQVCNPDKYYSGGSCVGCSTTKKVSLRSHIKIKETGCCADNKYYNSNNKCQQCSENCKTCADTTGKCIQCAKKFKLPPNYTIRVKKTSCCPNPDDYWKTSESTCVKCPDENCSSCEDGTGEKCYTCSNLFTAKNISVKIKKTSCCDKGEYRSGSDCVACPGQNCLDCQDVSGDCISCSKKVKGSTKVDMDQCCGDNKYWKLDASPTAACAACPDANCAECQNVTGKCLQCSIKIKLPKIYADVKNLPSCCVDKKYYSSGICVNCPANCDSCKDGDGTCLRCNSLMKASNVEVKIKKTSCCNQDNHYYKNGSCQNCDDLNCLMCQDVSGDCISCSKKVKGSTKVDMDQCCGDNKYWKLDASPTAACAACPDANCAECQNVTGKCLQCTTKIKLPKIYAGVKKLPSCCGDKKYYNGSGCTSCSDNCSACKDGDGTCLRCTSLMKASNVEVKIKKTSCCTDDNKYWSNNNQCEACSNHCTMCQDVSGDCIKCEKYMKGRALNINVDECCDPGEYYKYQTKNCQPCPDTNCASCENITGKCLECTTKIKLPKIYAGVKKLPSCCGDKQYYNGSSCTSCSDNCNACKDGDGTCLRCTSIMKVSNIEVKIKKTSCCTDDNKYWSNNNQCETCSSHCTMCQDVSGNCIKCEKYMKGRASNINVDECCDSGQYYKYQTKNCQPCPDTNCASCENITGKCLECTTKIKLPKIYAGVKKLPSCCGDKQYYNGSGCTSCSDNCNVCKDGDGTCLRCTSIMKVSNVEVKIKKTSCCIDDNKYWSNNNQCEACSDHCTMCQDVSGDCIKCEKYMKGRASNINVDECCDSGQYYKYQTKNCQPCPDTNCASCENITGKCLECTTKIKLPKIYADVKKLPSCCDDKKYYYNASCINCPDNCDSCKDGDGTCLRCSSLMKISNVKIKLKKTSCCTDDNKYWSNDNFQCEICSSHCAMCQDVSGDCIKCEKYMKGRASNINVDECCDPGQYYKYQTKSCQPCPDTNCASCENITGKCFECSKVLKLKVKAGLKKQPSCCQSTTQYFDNSQQKCLDCSSNCNLCEDVSGNCLQCSNSFKFKTSAAAKKTSCCPSGKFWNNSTKQCESCAGSCTSCEDVTGACICSKSFKFKAKAGIKPTSCCDSGKYYDNASCKDCQDNCFECVDGTGDCISCDEEFFVVTTVFSSTGGSCCPDGFYYSGGNCNACTKPCATCTSATKCTSCSESATFDKITDSCTCKSGYYKSPTDCERCKAPCNICSNDSTCTSCRAHATLDPSSKLCSCESGFTLNSTSTYGYCAANCNLLCTDCNIDDGSKCSKCVTNAELSGTKCSCTANSSYDSSSNTCVCNSGYTLAYNKCIGCKKYLAPTDVKSASFSSTWTSINIYFNAKIDTTLDPTCSKVFNSTTLAMLGTGPVCSWLDQRTLKVVLGSLFTQTAQTMYLDGTYLIKDTTDPCTITYQPLSVTPTSSISPSPTAVLSGPSSASLSCGSSDPLKYSGEKSTMSIGLMTYTWSSTISPANSKLSEYIKSQKTSVISIPKSYFDISVTTTLNLSLQVTNYFGLKSSAWIVTTVTEESSLSVIFDQGTSISMKASSSTTIKAKISSLCANSTSSTFSWSWKYYSGPKIDSASILQNANSDKLTIKKNALAATIDTPYVFMAIATQSYNGATITGNSTISITVTSSPLSIQLSKTSGDVSPDSDYSVDASGSKDPDESSGNLTYLWTCLNSADSTTCVGNDGKTLLDSETSVNLKISSSRLVKGAQWDITCTISKDVRTASATISLNILNTKATAKAEIVLKSEKFNPQGNNKFSASVASNYSPTLAWAVTSGQDVSISPNYLSAISLPSGTLTEGSSYTFTLSISAQGSTFKVHLPIYSNIGAACTGTASADPTTGNALTTSFKLSVDGCYDKDEEDYPLTYRYLDITGGKTYTLGYTTEINYLSTYLFPNENDITIKVCDSLVTCSDYSVILIISPANSRRLEASSLMDAYLENTIDSDNIPATISLFCGSATIDSDLFAKMWTDLQSYVAANEVTNDILQNALGAAYSMTTQTDQMSAELFTIMAAWLAEVIANNPSIVPSQENMVTVVALVNNYLTYGHLTNYVGMALEDYIINADKFLTYWEIAATLDELVTQSAMDGSQNTDMTKVFKYRDFPTSMVNHTAKIGENQTFSIPANLSYADTDIMNIKLHYYNISGEASDITMISFANSGSYVNYELQTSTETYVPFSTSDYPFVMELPISIDLGKHYSWDCLFYNESNKAWMKDGCEITQIKNNSIVFEVYHFSMFKLSQTEVVLPSKPSESSCDDNFAPLYILVVTLFISIVLAPILSLIDSKDGKKVNPELQSIELHPSSPALFIKKLGVETMIKNEDEAKAPNHPAGSLAVESINEENVPLPGAQNLTFLPDKEDEDEHEQTPKTPQDIKNIKGASTKGMFEEFQSSDSVLSKSRAEEVVFKDEPAETELQLLLEGHLLFGLVYFRHNILRTLRLFILVTVVIFELLLEGLLIYGFESTSKGKSSSTETLFNDYESVYFGYTILALVIAVPVELYMISAFAIDRSKAPFWSISAVILGILVLIGSIIGIVLLNIEFCFEWSGYWAISFLYGVLVQVFVVETLYMIGRYFTIQFFSENKKV